MYNVSLKLLIKRGLIPHLPMRMVTSQDQRASNKVVEIIEDETKSQPSKDKWFA